MLFWRDCVTNQVPQFCRNKETLGDRLRPAKWSRTIPVQYSNTAPLWLNFRWLQNRPIPTAWPCESRVGCKWHERNDPHQRQDRTGYKKNVVLLNQRKFQYLEFIWAAATVFIKQFVKASLSMLSFCCYLIFISLTNMFSYMKCFWIFKQKWLVFEKFCF